MKKVIFGLVAIWIIAVVSVFLNFFMTTDYQTDQKTEEDLRTIQNQVVTYANKNNKMPKSISDLNIQNIDVTKYEYKYEGIDRQNDEYKYQLCAVFLKKSKDKDLGYDNYIGGYHAAGRYCYDLRQYTLDTYSDINTGVNEESIEK